jgi:GR25 family glycosyltransferase involved in LPS biosynthesis
MVFDHAYCVNLERCTERRLIMQEEFKKANLEVEFIKAFDSGAHGITKSNLKPGLHPGDFGCLMSHHAIWNDMIEKDYKVALIFEDDVELCDEFTKRISELEFPKFWEIVYLEYISPVSEGRATRDMDEGRCLGTMAYLVTQECAKKLVQFTPKNWRGADVQLAQMPLASFFTTSRLANHVGLVYSVIGLDPSRIPIYHNALFLENEYGGYLALFVLLVLMFILVKRFGFI